MNRRGVLGEIIITIIGTFVIIIILVLFAFVSSYFKGYEADAPRVDKYYSGMGFGDYLASFNNQVEFRDLIYGSVNNTLLINSLCKWDGSDNLSIQSEIMNLKDQSSLIQVEKGGNVFYCLNECKNGRAAFTGPSEFFIPSCNAKIIISGGRAQ